MPAPISTHPHLGDLFDRLAVHMYAVGYAQQCIAALMALGDGEKVPQINFVRQALSEEQIVAAAGRAVAVKIVAREPITVDDWIEYARNIERAHGIGDAIPVREPAAGTSDKDAAARLAEKKAAMLERIYHQAEAAWKLGGEREMSITLQSIAEMAVNAQALEADEYTVVHRRPECCNQGADKSCCSPFQGVKCASDDERRTAMAIGT